MAPTVLAFIPTDVRTLPLDTEPDVSRRTCVVARMGRILWEPCGPCRVFGLRDLPIHDSSPVGRVAFAKRNLVTSTDGIVLKSHGGSLCSCVCDIHANSEGQKPRSERLEEILRGKR